MNINCLMEIHFIKLKSTSLWMHTPQTNYSPISRIQRIIFDPYRIVRKQTV